ncbi:hypothetical protein RND81_04G187000 [Saponaria officinalis]|uniref:Neprosin PEP catalytic domain-containing protein n=1 Tax=Saponaria officinalis TaxID=3572 RepID=A0AAW1LMS7_SAPOF
MNKPYINRAVVRTKDDAKKFIGAGAGISLFKPKVQNIQWSSSRIKLINGADSIEAGWMVNPEVFKDNEAHLYTKFSTGGRECINQLCSGFVEVDKNGYLGCIHQDDGHWWLSVIDENNNIIRIGYWPKNLFSSSLAEVATQVEWGGEINNPGASASQPEMGNGYKAYNTDAAIFSRIRTVNEGFQNIQPNDFEVAHKKGKKNDFDVARKKRKKNDFEVFQDCSPFYTAKDYGYYNDYWGHLIYFGGTRRWKNW